ncbi:MAG: hypothetical protein WHX52_15600 [Anaerolineae bacterium]
MSEAILSGYTPPIVLGSGERAVLALAQTFPQPLVLLDDEAARAEARRLNLSVCGTVGVVVAAYKQRRIPFAQAEFLLREIAARLDILP